ncbi:ABC transporter ATP-binding protein [Pilimelia columellifera]|uniref:ABC transporter ATP-binding protein n=1 Tax=Pilimelia columellifera TaxID=706574 RepID=UPI003CD05765
MAPSIPPSAVDQATAGGSALDVAGVTVRRGGQSLLREITWRVEHDQRWVVLGPNGAGKTTLLNLAAARSHPTSGSVTILGDRVGATDLAVLRARVGLSTVALADRLPADERVHDIVLTAAWSVVGRFREGYDAVDEDRACGLLAQLDVLDLADRPYGTLSEGERKRVQIARALMTDPELLLLDEPAAGLDLAGREQLVARLARLAADPLAPAMVLVTHHVEEIPPGFTHALLLRQGAVVAQGPLRATLTDDALSATFGLPLRLDLAGDRFTARAR